MKKTLFYNRYSTLILFTYFLVMLAVNIGPMDWKESLARSLLAIGLMFLHLYLAADRCVKLWAGSLNEPHFIVDWGSFGRTIEDLLPAKLQGRYTAVPAYKVEATKDQLLQLLENSNNFIYADPNSDASVEVVYFRVGDRVLEDEDEYLEHLIQVMSERFKKYHSALWVTDEDEKKGKKKDVDKERYLDEFIRTHKNGSALN